MPLSVLLASHGISRVDNVPVVDGLAATIKMAEMMVDLRRTSGLTVSRHGWFNAGPKPKRVEEVMKFYNVITSCGSRAMSRGQRLRESGGRARAIHAARIRE